MERSIVQLKHRECRFALTDQPGPVDSMAGQHHLFCGARVQTDSAYCARHHSLCYRGPGRPWQSVAEQIYRIERENVSSGPNGLLRISR